MPPVHSNQNLVNCRNQLYDKGYSWPTCSKQPRVVDCRMAMGVVNKLYRRRRRRVLLTKWSICCGEMLCLEHSSRGKYPNFWWYRNFLIPQCEIGGSSTTGPSCQNQSSISAVVSIQCRLVTDRQTDRWAHYDSKYHASIAPRGKKTDCRFPLL